MPASPDDIRHMRAALALAARGLGRTWPNPAVGCVIVLAGRVIGRGWTQPGGRPHAETEALARAGSAAHGATAYVTLEPCSHHGRTPPCTDALVAAGIGRVVCALGDPDPRVNGEGLERLRKAGIAVETGVLEAEAAALNAGFLLRVREGRPFVTLKLATTLDGRIATATGESQWITGGPARDAAQVLRAQHDAIMVGSNTALGDDPALTCRLPGLEGASPVRVVADRRFRLPMTSRLVRTARQAPVWVVTAPEAPPRNDLAALGVERVQCDGSMEGVLVALAARGITRVLVEGGAVVAAALLKDALVDQIVWFHAGTVIGGDGRAAVLPLEAARLSEVPRFRRVSVAPIGADVVSVWQRVAGDTRE
jgi:diaminohydroxyphosphoribosylaminopyrimidine deaminase / 5-amino-6-(5-phosphoribosylamino)uracil reductase